MEREAVLVGIDVGTSKVCALIGEVSRDGKLTIMGHGTVPASGLKKGVIIRSMDEYGYPNRVRVSIGLPAENVLFLKYFAQLRKGQLAI